VLAEIAKFLSVHGIFCTSQNQSSDPLDLGRWAIAELLLHPEFLCEHVAQATG
jgi:hypothetical protein